MLKHKKEIYKEAMKVTYVGLVINIVLSSFKIFAGFFGNSNAMVADGFHSLSDLLTDLIVITFLGISEKEKDKTHKYGHGKFETFGTMLIGFALFVVGISLMFSGILTIKDILTGIRTTKPLLIALIAAIISVIVKETLFWYTVKIGEKNKSSSVIANAWHHRSDALSSIATTIGIFGAIILGQKWIILDPIAGIIVSLLIVKMSIDITLPCFKELVENSLPENIESDIINAIKSVSGVKDLHNLKTRKIGSAFAIEVHVKVNKDLSVEESHNIATDIENKLREKYGGETHIGIHIEPFYQ